MAFSNNALNEMIEDFTAETISVRIHSAAPGDSGTTSRIGTFSEDLATGTWGTLADITDGRERPYDADVSYGTLSTTASNTVHSLSLWKGAEHQGNAALSAEVTVVANGTFKVNTGTIKVQLTSS